MNPRIVVVLPLFLLCGCGSQKVAAVVNGQVITVQEVQNRLQRMNPSSRVALQQNPQELIEDMVLEVVLLQEARRRGLDHDLEFQQLIKEARRRILMGRLIEQLRLNQQVQVAEEAVSTFYQENKDKFIQPETQREIPFEEVKDQIRQHLAARQQQEAVELFVQQLRAKSQIQVRESGIPSQSSSP